MQQVVAQHKVKPLREIDGQHVLSVHSLQVREGAAKVDSAQVPWCEAKLVDALSERGK